MQAEGAHHCHWGWRLSGRGRPCCQPVQAQYPNHQGTLQCCLSTCSPCLSTNARVIGCQMQLKLALATCLICSPCAGAHHSHGCSGCQHWHQDSRQLRDGRRCEEEQVGHIQPAPCCLHRQGFPGHPGQAAPQQWCCRGESCHCLCCPSVQLPVYVCMYRGAVFLVSAARYGLRTC